MDPSYAVHPLRDGQQVRKLLLPDRLTSASADSRAVRTQCFAMAFCSGLAADEATAEAAKTSILTRLRRAAQGFPLIIQEILPDSPTSGPAKGRDCLAITLIFQLLSALPVRELDRHHPAIHRQDVARHIACRIRSQEDRRPHQVLIAAQPPERRHGNDLLVDRLQDTRAHL